MYTKKIFIVGHIVTIWGHMPGNTLVGVPLNFFLGIFMR